MITAPYNFVPLNKEVFFPSWAEDVNHDIPFEDGESGEIDITITAKSPIFVRDHKNPEQFCNYNGQYYIPSTSIKGMVRNVLEIMSFSKMSFINDTTYSLRDLKYDKYLNQFKDNKVQCGWLYKTGNEYKIEDCGIPYRIKYDEINSKFNINFKRNFMDGTFNNANSPYKKAYKKYNLLNQLSNKNIFNQSYTFSLSVTDGAGRKIVTFQDNGNIQGKLVLTGHPSPRKEPEKGKASGKIYDFVFEKKENPDIYTVDKKVFENFKFAYFDSRTTQPKESPDWTFWKEKLNSGEKIPVFFHKYLSSISSFGLSYLYKFPYKNSIMKALLQNHTSKEIDLAESMFGYSKKIDNKQHSLKGRVYFSHAKKTNSTQPLTSRYVLLGSPKASYYPIYLVQNGNEYKTLMDNNSILAGWKRYPVHKKFSHNCEGSSTQTSLITPLPKDTKFNLKIKVHNLKKVEIGALLSALAFHNTSNTYHNIGLAKSYGYGKIKLDIQKINGFRYSIQEYLKYFETCMNVEIFNNEIKWHESEQIKNLLTMATEQDDNNLGYMKLTDFAKEKNDKNYLDRYINLDNVQTKTTIGLSSKKDLKIYQRDTEELRQKYLQRQEERRIKEEEDKIKQEKQKEKNVYQKELDGLKDCSDETKLQSFIQRYQNKFDISEIRQQLDGIKSQKQNDKFTKINAQAQKAYNETLKKKGTKGFTKAKDGFIKKWSAEKNNKGSSIVLELVEKIKKIK